jgi:hypothetical protein
VAKMIDVVVLMEILNKEGHWDGESTAMQVKDHHCKPISKLGTEVVMIHDKTKSEDDILFCTMCIKASNQASGATKHVIGDVNTFIYMKRHLKTMSVKFTRGHSHLVEGKGDVFVSCD